MRDRSEKYLRLACLVLATLAAAEISHAILRMNPLKGVAVPAVPTLVTNAVANTNSMANETPDSGLLNSNKIPAGRKIDGFTNVTTTTSLTANSNPASATDHVNPGTSGVMPTITAQTNVTVQSTGTVAIVTNNKSGILKTDATTNLITTNIIAGTNATAGTNSVAGTNVSTNAPIISVKHHSSHKTGTGMGGMMDLSGGSATALPTLIQARVDQIVNSEIFAPVMHPQPMALLGIAGDTIFLRTDSGQSGLVKIGDSLGNVKLLRIGINRALVEQDGQKKELTIFNGYGSDSLLSTKDESPK